MSELFEFGTNLGPTAVTLSIPKACADCGHVFADGDEVVVWGSERQLPFELKDGLELARFRFICDSCASKRKESVTSEANG